MKMMSLPEAGVYRDANIQFSKCLMILQYNQKMLHIE